jgi:putative YhdH/YhfP family quinone oxidoreductase
MPSPEIAVTPDTIKCYCVEKPADGPVTASVVQRPIGELPEGDLLIKVAWSSLNYKDALAATGHPGVARNFPHVPGIDASGTVVQSKSDKFQEGDAVLVTGFELGVSAWGGYAEYVSVPAAWVVALPSGLNLRQSMILGTAGFTAAICVEALMHNGVRPGVGEVLVTGATGGVGSLAVAILSKNGYRVVASTGKETAHDFLRDLGAAEIIGRDEVHDESARPLLKARWNGAVDTVGGNTLTTVLRTTQPHGCVACCGLVGGANLPMTVYPFILRGVQLSGADSATYPIEHRPALWGLLADAWCPEDLELLVCEEVELEGLDDPIQRILAGRIRGRVMVRLSGA